MLTPSLFLLCASSFRGTFVCTYRPFLLLLPLLLLCVAPPSAAAATFTATTPQPHRELQALAREAYFYQLQELLHHIQHTAIVPQPSTRTFYDMLYLETGFRPIEDPQAMRGMERAKTVLMQQLNHMIHKRAQDGYAVEDVLPGTAHKTDGGGGGSGGSGSGGSSRGGGAGRGRGGEGSGSEQHNLFYNVLMKKVVPLLPQEMLPDVEDDADGDGMVDDDTDEQREGGDVGVGGGAAAELHMHQHQQRHGAFNAGGGGAAATANGS